MIDQETLTSRARGLWDHIEPIAANVYFAPEVHSAYEELGFAGSSASGPGGIQYPDRVAYFISRGACLGVVPGEVIAAAFGVFKRDVVVAAVDEGRPLASVDDVLAARQKGATASLVRMLGEKPDGLDRATEILERMAAAAPHEGRHLFAGLLSLGYPDDPMGRFWRAADLVREHRGDSHIAAWLMCDFDACEIGLITDPWRGMPLRSWVRTRGWTEEELDAATGRLTERGLLDDDGITAAGRELRDRVEELTDVGERRTIEAAGDDIQELFALLEPWRDTVIETGGYPAPARRR